MTGGRRGHHNRAAARQSSTGVRRHTVGWEFVHVCINDATHLAYVEVLPDEKGTTTEGFLRRAVAWLGSYGR